jgi:hypothetical protein
VLSIKSYLLITTSLITIALAVSCSGGGGSTDAQNAEGNNIKFKLINKYHEKFAVLSQGSKFIISSDLSDRADPQEATHVRARLFVDGKMVKEKLEPIPRSIIPPYEIDQNTRFITLSGMPDGDYRCTIDLGQDFGEDTISRKEIIYYTGGISNVKIEKNKVFFEGEEKTTVEVAVSVSIDVNSGAYSIQGFSDFSSIPRIASASTQILNVDANVIIPSQTAVETVDEEGAFTFGTTNFVLNESTEFQSQFFEIKNIPIEYTSLFGVSEAGSPQNFILTSFVSESDTFAGKVLLFDWETSFTMIMARWYNYITESQPIELVEQHKNMSKVFKMLAKLTTDPIPENSKYIETNQGELLILNLAYLIAFELNVGRNNFIPAKFDDAIIRSMNKDSYKAVNEFLFTSANTARPIKVNLTDKPEPIYFDSELKSSSLWDVTIHGNAQSRPASTLTGYQIEIETLFERQFLLDFLKTSLSE